MCWKMKNSDGLKNIAAFCFENENSTTDELR